MKKKYIIPETTMLMFNANVVMLDTSGGSTGDDESETKYFNSVIGDDITDETDGD